MDKILTVPQVAAYLKVSRTTVWRWCNEGRLPAFRAGHGWRIHRTDVEHMVGQPLDEISDRRRPVLPSADPP
jgi:excisionase family DNA binding protein